jgi:hypothetical protein
MLIVDPWQVYWNMWVRSFRSLCDSWVAALSSFPAVSAFPTVNSRSLGGAGRGGLMKR